ncbi:MAG: hypothetical protein DHS20C12_02740 [Pseudohongiella sp.]|nr:MAG: hypothetical protein DHS20C12_02740 [Pseudohongiella sp.]
MPDTDAQNAVEPERDPVLIRQKLNQDTARIRWSALVEHQQKNMVIRVSTDLDLIDVGCDFTLDNSAQVKAWMDKGQVQRVDDTQAEAWLAADYELWAVVVAPWVLVQEPKPNPNPNPESN